MPIGEREEEGNGLGVLPEGRAQKANYLWNHLTPCKTTGPQTWVYSTTLWLLDQGPGKPTRLDSPKSLATNRSGYLLYFPLYKVDDPFLNLPHFTMSFRGKRIKTTSQLLIMFLNFKELVRKTKSKRSSG